MSAFSLLILLHLHTSCVWSGVECFRWSLFVTFTHSSFISRGARRGLGRVYIMASQQPSPSQHILHSQGHRDAITNRPAKMSRSMAVTRTFSMGNCSGSSRVSDPQDIQGARRHSLVGMRAHMWANSSRSLGWERVASKDNILSNVVTPSSIPQFTIPRLAVEDSVRCTGQDRERSGKEEDAETNWVSLDETEYYVHMSTSLSSSSSSYSSSTSSGLGSPPAMSRKARRSISDPESLKGAFVQRRTSRGAQHLYDPATCAALSLPHLPKVTTPYGFVTLSQSPQMASEEALLFQAGLSRRWGRLDEENTSIQQRHLRPEQRKSLSSSQSLPPAITFSSAHMPPAPTPLQGTDIQRDEGGTSAEQDNPDSSRTSGSKPKCRFWGVLRKHFVSQKCRQR